MPIYPTALAALRDRVNQEIAKFTALVEKHGLLDDPDDNRVDLVKLFEMSEQSVDEMADAVFAIHSAYYRWVDSTPGRGSRGAGCSETSVYEAMKAASRYNEAKTAMIRLYWVAEEVTAGVGNNALRGLNLLLIATVVACLKQPKIGKGKR